METEIKYFSDVTNRQWQLIRQLLPRISRRGRKPIDRRRIINAILYVVRTDCKWRMLPKDFPNWNTVYGIFLALAQRWYMAKDSRRLAGQSATSGRQEVDANRGDRRQPIDSHGRRRRRKRL